MSRPITIQLTARNLAIGVVAFSTMVFLLLLLTALDNRRKLSEQRAAGLASVASGWDPVSLWQQATWKHPARSYGNFGAQLGGYSQKGPLGETPQKLVQTAEMHLQVADVSKAIENLRSMAAQANGYVDASSISGQESDSPFAEVTLRVPAGQLRAAMEGMRSLSTRVETEEVKTEDVTRQFVDLDARLRNMRAEEARYLEILKRASTVKDTLDVTHNLAEVRAHIEQAQGEMNLLNRQVDLSLIHVSLRRDTPVRIFGVEWHPGTNATLATHNLIEGLVDWTDSLVAFTIRLPLHLLWIASVVVVIWLAVMVVAFLWRRLSRLVPIPWRRVTP
jgi:hypothetical protein